MRTPMVAFNRLSIATRQIFRSHTFGSKNTREKFQEYFVATEDTRQWE